MFNISDAGLKNELAERLASATGLSKDQAQRFLDALSEISKADEQIKELLDIDFKYVMPDAPSSTHVISIPLVEHEDGTLTVDPYGYSSLLPFVRPKRTHTQPTPTPAQPPTPGPPSTSPPNTPTPPPIQPAPGAYPGPSFVARVSDWLDQDVKLDRAALRRLLESSQKIELISTSGDLTYDYSSGYEKQEVE